MSNNRGVQKKSGLGGNPLDQGLFSQTDTATQRKLETENLDSRSKILESRFLHEVELSEKESIGLQVTAEINDWLDEVVKGIRRKHGRKIPKQILIQAGIELLRAMPIDWTDVESLDVLRLKLLNIVSVQLKAQ